MRNFEYYTPTQVLFGKDTHLQAGSLLKKYGAKKVLIHYGGQSAVRSGLIDEITSNLKEEGLEYITLGGVIPNPLLSKVREGIELCQKEHVDFILAVGGGSVIDSSKAIGYGVANPIIAIENLTATTLRNIIGDLELDQTLTSRETINTRMRAELDLATDPWGIKVNRVELKNIIPPTAIRDAMEKQMKAERERREKILQAEGEKRSAVLVAEGEKEAAILRADAKKQAQILEAQGEAEAILTVQRATAEGIKLINEATPTDPVIKLKALEAFAAAANGRATKIIIPSEIQGLAGLAEGIVEAVKLPEKPAAKQDSN